MAGKFPDMSQLMAGRGGGGMPDMSQLMGGRGGAGGGGGGGGGMPDLTQLMAARGGGGGAMPDMSQFAGGGGGAQDLLRKAQEYNDAVRRGDTEAMNRGIGEFSGISNAAMRHTGGGVQTGPDPPRPSEEEQAQDPNALATWLQICLNNARLRGDHDRAEELEREQLAHCGQRHAEATAAAPPRSSAPTARSEELAKLDKLSADAQARGDIQEALKLRDLVIAKGQEYNGDMEGPATGVPGYIEPSNAPSGSSSQAPPAPAPAPAPARPAPAPAPSSAAAAVPPPPGSLPAPPPHASSGDKGKEKEKEKATAAAAAATHVDEVAEKMRGLQVDTANTAVLESAPVQSPLASSALPTGWSQHEDPKTGAVYFYNQSTGETSWNRPTGGAAAASPPPPPPPASAVSSPPPSSAPSHSRPPRNWMRVSHSRVQLVDGVIIDLDLGKLIVAGPAGRRIKMKCFSYSPGMVANPYSQSSGSGSQPERPKPTEFKSMQGYLVKLSHRKSIFNNEVWQKRYFVLDKNQIKYYKNDRLGKAKGAIPLQAGGWACAVEKGQDRRKDAFAFKDQYSMRKMLTANVGAMMSEYDGHITKDHCLAVHHPQGKTMDLNSIMEKNVFQLAAANKSQQKNTARTFYLLADSDRQRDEWLEAIDNNLVFACTAEGSEQAGAAGGGSGPEHPNPAIDRLIGVIRMAGGDPSLTDVEGVVQELTGLYPE